MLTPKKFFLGRSFRIHPHLQSYVCTDAHGIVGTPPSNYLGLCMGVVKGDEEALPFVMPYKDVSDPAEKTADEGAA